jgi:lysophospholipase L1-like esterase
MKLRRVTLRAVSAVVAFALAGSPLTAAPTRAADSARAAKQAASVTGATGGQSRMSGLAGSAAGASGTRFTSARVDAAPSGDLVISMSAGDLDPTVLQSRVASFLGTGSLSDAIANSLSNYNTLIPVGTTDNSGLDWPGCGTCSITESSSGSGDQATDTLTIDVPAVEVQANFDLPGWTVSLISGTVATLGALIMGALCTAAFAPAAPAAPVVCGPVFAFFVGFIWNVVSAYLTNQPMGDPKTYLTPIIAGLISAAGAAAVGPLLAWASANLRNVLISWGTAVGTTLRSLAGWIGTGLANGWNTYVAPFFAALGAAIYDIVTGILQSPACMTLCGFGAAQAAGFLRVLPFGDSITYGYQSSDGNGYRCDLQNNLAVFGFGYQFVGSQSAGDCAQPDNEGHSGWTIGQLAAIEHCTISGYQPNVVLLDIGTNDINNGGAPGPAAAALESLINNILSDDSGVTVLVSSLIQTPNAAVAANMASFNQQISAWISSVSPGEHVMYVDQGAVQLDDLADGLHPNDTGYNMMAFAWTAAVDQAIGNGWIHTANAPGGGGCTGGAPIWYPQGVIATGPGTVPPDQPGGEPLPSGARVQFADITGDGRADYLQINADGSVDAWLNTGPNGAGGVVWKSVGEIATGVGSPGSEVQFADITGDGKADYLVVDPATGTTTAWANGGQNASAQDGWLWTSLPVVVNGDDDIGQGPNLLGDPSGTRVQYADIDGDGKADFLAVLPGGGVYAWLNGGVVGGAFAWTSEGEIATGVGSPGSEVQFADVTGDGKADYLVVDAASGAVTLWRNGGANASANNGWDWIPDGQIATGVAPGAQIQFGDVNGDGKADYLDVDPSTGSVTAYQNGGADASATDGWLWTPMGAIADGIGNQIQFADMSGNGRDDYLDVRPDGSVLEWYNAGVGSNGTIVWVGPLTIATGVGAPGAEVRFADVFGTGRADYLVVDPATGAVTAWENEGPGGSGASLINWAPRGVIATGVGALGSEVHFADVWGTHRADYLTVDPSTGAVDDWYNAGLGSNGLPVWIPHLQIATGVAPGNEIRFADLYGTGRADYLVVNPDSSVQAWLNDGANSAATDGWLWLPQGTVATGVGAPGSQIQFADVAGSGRDDYLDVNPDGSVSAWFNGGPS